MATRKVLLSEIGRDLSISSVEVLHSELCLRLSPITAADMGRILFRIGRTLWHTTVAANQANGAITYELDGKQYVVVGAGDSLFAFTLGASHGSDRQIFLF